jgi:hypothetical protein
MELPIVMIPIVVNSPPCLPVTATLAIARNQPGQSGGNQGPMFVAHIAALIRDEMKAPLEALTNTSRDHFICAF